VLSTLRATVLALPNDQLNAGIREVASTQNPPGLAPEPWGSGSKRLRARAPHRVALPTNDAATQIFFSVTSDCCHESSLILHSGWTRRRTARTRNRPAIGTLQALSARLQPPRTPETAATRTVRVMLLSARECSTSSAVCSLSTVQHAPWVVCSVNVISDRCLYHAKYRGSKL
jgi:hypothetical protein